MSIVKISAEAIIDVGRPFCNIHMKYEAESNNEERSIEIRKLLKELCLQDHEELYEHFKKKEEKQPEIGDLKMIHNRWYKYQDMPDGSKGWWIHRNA